MMSWLSKCRVATAHITRLSHKSVLKAWDPDSTVVFEPTECVKQMPVWGALSALYLPAEGSVIVRLSLELRLSIFCHLLWANQVNSCSSFNSLMTWTPAAMTWWGQTNTGRQWAAERSWSFVKIWRQTNKQTLTTRRRKRRRRGRRGRGRGRGRRGRREGYIYILETPCELSQVA